MDLRIFGDSSKGSFTYKDDSDFLYIQMQRCQLSLADWLRQNDTREMERMKSWFKQIVSAVEYLHNKNTIHRDLKPSNILIYSNEVVKICDLGIATVIENGEESLEWRTSIGSQLYRAPEQLGIPNYANDYIDLPLNSTSSLVSMLSYSVIIAKMHYARLHTQDVEQAEATLLHKEYRYAIQFATMALAYSCAWIFFRVFPIIIGETSNLYIYGVVTILAEMNMLTNSTVYLVNNAEIKKSLRNMMGHGPQTNALSKMEVTTSNATSAISTMPVTTF